MSNVMPLKAKPYLPTLSDEEIRQAIERGAQRYFDECRAGVADFIDRHFYCPGALATNRVALGRVYYTLFPPEPPLVITAGIFAGVMALLAAFAAMSGIITDPVQAATGLHRRRLHKMLNHLQQDFLNQNRNSFRPKD